MICAAFIRGSLVDEAILVKCCAALSNFFCLYMASPKLKLLSKGIFFFWMAFSVIGFGLLEIFLIVKLVAFINITFCILRKKHRTIQDQ